VIIKHNEFTFSKLCHLKYQSIEVASGETIKQGQILGKCGNSGRSPYPHLHFQFQSTPFIGSTTIDYPFGRYLLKNEKTFSLKTFEYPIQGQVIANPPENKLLAKSLHFIPGQRIKVDFNTTSTTGDNKQQTKTLHWIVETDIYNTTYLKCLEDGSIAYIHNDGYLHYFTNYIGKKQTALYWFYLGTFKIPLGFLPNSKIIDSIPVNLMFGGILKFLQDFTAPLYLFLKADYKLNIKKSGDILSSGDVNMNTTITKKFAGKNIGKTNFELNFSQNGSIKILIDSKASKMQIICRNELD
jgi:hypothetical protein